jgi:hypothetical protein
MYKLHKNDSGEVVSVTHNGMGIPFDLANTDYQVYLEWVSEGNSPYPADSATPEEAE